MAVRTALRQAGVVDRAALSVRPGVIAAVPVAGMLALGTAIGQSAEAVTMGVGAMLVGVAWRASGPTNPPLGTMSAAAGVLALCTVVGTLTGRWPWLHLSVLFVLCLVAGLATATGRRGSVVGTQSLIAFIVFGRFPENFGNAVGLAGLVLAGGVAQVLFASIAAAPLAWRHQRLALAEAYRQIADVATEMITSTVPAAVALDSAEQALAAPALFGDHHLAGLISLVAEGRRMRLELMSLAVARSHVDRAHPDVVEASEREVRIGLGLVGGLLSAVADACSSGETGKVAPAAEALRSWSEERLDLPSAAVDGHLAALGGQARAAARLAESVLGGDRPAGWRSLVTGWGRPSLGTRRRWDGLRADLRQVRDATHAGTAPGRHALRLALVVAGTELLTQRLAIPRGYWAVVAAATVLRPGFGATITRGAERMLGTCAGVVIATLIAVAVDPQGWGVTAVVGLLAAATYTVFPASFAAGTAGLTAMIVFLLHAVSPDSVTIGLDRGLDTIIGGVIGLGAYTLWPTWSAAALGTSFVVLIDAQRDYLSAVLAGMLGGAPRAGSELRRLARRARISFGDAEAALDAARGEPARPGHSHDRDAATLAALRRVVFGIHAVRLATVTGEAHPEAAALAAAASDALGVVRDRADASPRHPAATLGELPPLRRIYRSCSSELGDGLSVALDELVDAIDSAGAILGR